MRNKIYAFMLLFVMTAAVQSLAGQPISRDSVTNVVCWPADGGSQTVETCDALFYDSGGSDGNISANNENSNGTQFVQFTLRDSVLVLCPEIDSTGVADRSTDFVAYPNPAHDEVFVKMRDGGERFSFIEVLDLNGRSLFAVPTQELTRVDLSRLPAGIYFLKPEGRQVGAVKIVKQ